MSCWLNLCCFTVGNTSSPACAACHARSVYRLGDNGGSVNEMQEVCTQL